MCVKEKGTTNDKLERESVCVHFLCKHITHASPREKSEARRYVIVCNGERHPCSTCPIEVWPTRNKGQKKTMKKQHGGGGLSLTTL